jgi:hypothetical protein
MAKRCTDSEKWQKLWISKLSPNYKLFWVYLLDMVDNAGIYDVNLGLAEYLLGVELNHDQILNEFGKHIVEIRQDKWFIPKFVEFQYGDLNPNNKAHLSVINKMNKYNLTMDKGHISTLNAPKDKEKVSKKIKRKPQNIEEVKKYFKEKNIEVDPYKFYNFYEANGWVQGKNKPIKNWKACVATWRSREDQEKPKQDGTIVFSCPVGCSHLVAKKESSPKCEQCGEQMKFIGDL